MKLKHLALVICSLLLLSSCNPFSSENRKLREDNEQQSRLYSKLSQAIAFKTQEYIVLNNCIKNKYIILKSNGNVHYIIKVKIHQTSYSLSVSEYIKNKINDIELEIPVDKEYYNSLHIGSRLDEGKLKYGSLLRDGDFSILKMTVINKRITGC